jgi:hypothetical protein
MRRTGGSAGSPRPSRRPAPSARSAVLRVAAKRPLRGKYSDKKQPVRSFIRSLARHLADFLAFACIRGLKPDYPPMCCARPSRSATPPARQSAAPGRGDRSGGRRSEALYSGDLSTARGAIVSTGSLCRFRFEKFAGAGRYYWTTELMHDLYGPFDIAFFQRAPFHSKLAAK